MLGKLLVDQRTKVIKNWYFKWPYNPRIVFTKKYKAQSPIMVSIEKYKAWSARIVLTKKYKGIN